VLWRPPLTPWARGIAAALPLALAASLVAVTAPMPRAAEAAPKSSCPASRPDRAAALVTARLCKGRVAVDDATTETSLTWANPEGTLSTQMDAGPERVKQDGKWVDVDTDLRLDADGVVRAVAPAVALDLFGGDTAATRLTAADRPLITAARANGKRISMGWKGNLPRPALNGDTALYSNVSPGVDVTVQLTATGFQQHTILKSRPDKPVTFTVPLRLNGLTARRVDGGGVELLDAAKTVVGNVPAPSMWGAQLDPVSQLPTKTAIVDYTLTPRSYGVDLILTPDQGFLADPTTLYPVTVDPDINFKGTFDTWVQQGTTTDGSASTQLAVGVDASGNPARSFINWDPAPIRGKQIVEAHLGLFNTYSATCGDRALDVYSAGLASVFTRWVYGGPGTLAQPAMAATKSGSTSGSKGQASCAAGYIYSTPHALDALVQGWAGTSSGQVGMGLKAPSETVISYFKRVYSGEAPNGKPFMYVTYNTYPTVGARQTSPSTVCATGTARPYINTTQPTLKTVITDAEGGTVTANFEAWITNGAKAGGATSSAGASGSTLSAVLPGGALADGGTYSWRVQGNDGTGTGPWSSWCEFTVDTTAPSTAPQVTSTVYPEGQWAGLANTAGTFTFGASSVSDVAAYEYGLDVNPPNQTVNAASLGGTATATLTPTADGPHTLYVRSRDRAGNESPTKAYAFSVGAGGLIRPSAGAITAGQVSLSAVAQTSAVGVTYQWRRGDIDAWAAIPVSDVTQATGGTAVTWPFAGTAGQFAMLNWNVATTLNDAEAGPDPLSGPLQVRAQFTNSTVSSAVNITFDPSQASAESSNIGPGTVNLVTGNFSVAASDVSLDSYDTDLTLSRAFNSRLASKFDSTHMFGPGWISSAVVESAEAPFTSLSVAGSLVSVGLPDGSTIGFTKKTSSTFKPQVGYEALTLTYASGQYTLADQEGNRVIFSQISGAPAGMFSPTSVSKPGSGDSIALSWQATTADGVTVVRPTQVLAPLPAGVSGCSALVKGCRALSFTYATTTTAAGTTTGDFAGRLSKVSFTAWDPSAAAMKTVDVSDYAYDSSGRLAAQWDPRLDNGTAHLWNTYTYNTDGTLASIGPTGPSVVTPNPVPPWLLGYTTVPGDPGAGRLAAVSRSALSAGASTTTVIYNVPLTKSAHGPYNMDAATVATWGEGEPPTQAAAVFPADQVPDGNQAAGTMPTNWAKATVSYMNADSRLVNRVTPGGNIATTWYDRYGKTIKTLDAGNRQEALTAEAETNFNMTSVQLADALSSVTTYSSDDTQIVSIAGPYHALTLADGTRVIGRDVTDTQYDQGAPDGTCPCGEITKTIDSVTYGDGGTPSSGTLVTGAEPRTTITDYDWTLRQPVRTIVDPAGLALTTTETYDPVTGQVASETTPGGGSTTNTPSTINTVYYSSGANSAHTACGGHAEWAGMICLKGAGGQSDTGPEVPTTQTTYDMYNQPLVLTESNSGGVLRTTTYTYDAAERQVSETIVGANGTGTPIPTRRDVYDPTSGFLVHAQSVDGSGNVTAQTTTAYDALGRVMSYTDTDGAQSTTTYDLMNRPISRSDGSQSRTISYDTDGENRGLATKIIDGQVGTITATFDQDGNLAGETWPNGIVVTYGYDDGNGALTSEVYTKPGCGQSDCTLDRESADLGQGGTIVALHGGFQAAQYDYDNDNRLTNAHERGSSGTCTTRAYGFGANAAGRASDRTSLTIYGPDSLGNCQTATAQSTATWTYDTADRITNTGYTYDNLGRTTTVPAADTQLPAGGALKATYHVNDLVRTLQQGDKAGATYNLDVDNQRIRSWTDQNGATHTNHYSTTSDSPTWTDNGSAGSQRNVTAPSGLVAIASNTSAITWAITDLRGNVVATVNNSDVGIGSVSTTDEYGVLNDSGQVGVDRYAWLGGKQRAADNPDGIVLMGVRLYNPVTGRFLSVDPVRGGSANAYDYVTANPVNSSDPGGRRAWRAWRAIHWWGISVHATASRSETAVLHEDTQGGSLAFVGGLEFGCSRIPIWQAALGCGIFVAFNAVWASHAINSAYYHHTCLDIRINIIPFISTHYWIGTTHGTHCRNN
jgi:RHS repeat-associated protein